MQTFLHNVFDAGWCPSDDPVNGRKNGMLRMENVELDRNGALQMTGGVKSVLSSIPGTLHTIWTKFLKDAQYIYATRTNGQTYRSGSSIATGGSATRTGFGAYADFALIFSDTKRVRDNGTSTVDLGQVKDSIGPTLGVHGAGNLTGDIEYVQLNVYNGGGGYLARSAPGVIATITLDVENADVTAHNPTSPANEVWIFRRGGDLPQFYRVKVLTSSYTTLFEDTMTDEDAANNGITLNLLAVPVDSTNLSDPVIEVVGPVNNRMIYFTKNTIYPSEINSPESFVPGRGIYIAGSATAAAIFLFAKKVNDNTVLVATTQDWYLLSGTWITLPDGTYDVYYRSIGQSKFAAISIDADVYNGGVAFMCHDGPRIMYPSGQTESLVDERVDRLYRGETPYTNALGVPIYILPQYRYSVAVARNKLWIRMPAITSNNPALSFTSTFHVFDFKRKYWRVLTNVPDFLFAQEDGAVIGYWDSDDTIKEINNQFQKLDDSTKQNIAIQFPVWTLNGNPRNRKDFFTLKLKVSTGGADTLTVAYSTDSGATFTTLSSTVAASSLTEKFLDMSGVTAAKTIQIKLTGQLADLILTDISIDYEDRPNPVTFLLVPRVDMDGLDGKKFRPRIWPFIIDTLGGDVTFTPIIDGSDGTTTTFNTSTKRIANHYFGTDVFPLNLGFKLSGVNPFEFYKALAPEVVQVLPIAKRFDQVGPVELFQYGKLKEFRVRLFSDSSANIPYIVYMQDVSIKTGNIAAVANVEDTYVIQLSKEVVGTNLRIVFGPTAFNFYRYYVQVKMNKSGKESDMEWITLPEQQQ